MVAGCQAEPVGTNNHAEPQSACRIELEPLLAPQELQRRVASQDRFTCYSEAGVSSYVAGNCQSNGLKGEDIAFGEARQLSLRCISALSREPDRGVTFVIVSSKGVDDFGAFFDLANEIQRSVHMDGAPVTYSANDGAVICLRTMHPDWIERHMLRRLGRSATHVRSESDCGLVVRQALGRDWDPPVPMF